MKRRIRLLVGIPAPGPDASLYTLVAVAHDETVWGMVPNSERSPEWYQLESLPDAPDDMRDQMVGAVRDSIEKSVARGIFRDLGTGFSEDAIRDEGKDFASWEAGFNAARDTAFHRLGLREPTHAAARDVPAIRR